MSQHNFEETIAKLEPTASELSGKLRQLFEQYLQLGPHVDRYDYGDVQHNGLRSFLLMIEKFIVKSGNILQRRNSEKRRQRLHNVASILLTMGELIVDLVLKNRSLEESEVVDRLLSITEEQYLSLLRLNFFWLPEDVQRGTRIQGIILSLANRRFSNLVLSSRRRRYQAWNALQANILEMQHTCEFFEKDIFISMTRRKYPCQVVQSWELRAKTTKQIQPDGSIVNEERDTAVQWQIIRATEESNGVVIMHAHGGGFAMGRPVMHQGYLRRWAREMPGVTVITPDYRLAPAHPYPDGLQDLCDSYLALTGAIESNMSSEKVLGFEPSFIIVMGDSAGGCLALSMARFCHRIGRTVPQHMILLYPSGSPCFSVLNPSRILCCVELIVGPAGLLNLQDAYCPGSKAGTDGALYREDRTAWFRRSERSMIDDRLAETTRACNRDELLNPLLGKFDLFRNSRILCISSQFDLVLDDAIEICTKWPDPKLVELCVVEGVQHGYVMGQSPTQLEAHRITLERVLAFVQKRPEETTL